MDDATHTTSSPETQGLEQVRAVAKKCQQLVDRASLGFTSKAQFLVQIKEMSAAEAEDYVEQLSQRLCQPIVLHQPREGFPDRGEGNSGE
jgi:hypothetical protein